MAGGPAAGRADRRAGRRRYTGRHPAAGRGFPRGGCRPGSDIPCFDRRDGSRPVWTPRAGPVRPPVGPRSLCPAVCRLGLHGGAGRRRPVPDRACSAPPRRLAATGAAGRERGRGHRLSPRAEDRTGSRRRLRCLPRPAGAISGRPGVRPAAHSRLHGNQSGPGPRQDHAARAVRWRLYRADPDGRRPLSRRHAHQLRCARPGSAVDRHGARRGTGRPPGRTLWRGFDFRRRAPRDPAGGQKPLCAGHRRFRRPDAPWRTVRPCGSHGQPASPARKGRPAPRCL